MIRDIEQKTKKELVEVVKIQQEEYIELLRDLKNLEYDYNQLLQKFNIISELCD